MATNFRLTNEKTGNQVEFNFDEGGSPVPPSPSDVSNSIVTFTQASTRANISTGEKLSVICGKIKKFFSDLKAVAFSGSYNDLTDKPSIPTVNNATLTVKQGGTTKGTFTANASTDVEIDLDVGGGSDIDTWDVNVTIPSGSYVLNVSVYGVNYTDDLSNPCMVGENYDAFWQSSYDMFFQTYLERTLSGDIGGVGFEDIEIKTMNKNSSSAEVYQAIIFQTTASGGHYYQMICVYMADKFNYYLLDPFGSEPYYTDADLTFDLKCLKYVRFADNRNI